MLKVETLGEIQEAAFFLFLFFKFANVAIIRRKECVIWLLSHFFKLSNFLNGHSLGYHNFFKCESLATLWFFWLPNVAIEDI
jgi:hypothetical protein